MPLSVGKSNQNKISVCFYLDTVFLFGGGSEDEHDFEFFFLMHKEVLYCIQREHMANETTRYLEKAKGVVSLLKPVSSDLPVWEGLF